MLKLILQLIASIIAIKHRASFATNFPIFIIIHRGAGAASATLLFDVSHTIFVDTLFNKLSKNEMPNGR